MADRSDDCTSSPFAPTCGTRRGTPAGAWKRRVSLAALGVPAAVAAASVTAVVAGNDERAAPQESRPAPATWPAPASVPGDRQLPSLEHIGPTISCPHAGDARVQAEPYAVPSPKDQPPSPSVGPTICLAAASSPQRAGGGSSQ